MAHSKLEEHKKTYFDLSVNAERMTENLSVLESRFERNKASLKELQNSSKNFAEMKIEVENSKEQYKTAIVIIF